MVMGCFFAKMRKNGFVFLRKPIAVKIFGGDIELIQQALWNVGPSSGGIGIKIFENVGELQS